MASDNNQGESLLELFLFETAQNVQQLEESVLTAEREGRFSEEEVNEVFRIMHTIKGSSAMMSFSEVATLAHHMEDLFSYIRENHTARYDTHVVSDLILACVDYVGVQLDNIRVGAPVGQNDSAHLVKRIEALMAELKGEGVPAAEPAAPVVSRYKALIFFEEGCEMEDVRAYSCVLDIGKYATVIAHEPENILELGETTQAIREHGFTIHFETELSEHEVREKLMQTVFLRELDLSREDDVSGEAGDASEADGGEEARRAPTVARDSQYRQQQSIISVSVNKLDLMMDLMGELVIAKTMVADNPELAGVGGANFHKAAAQLSKIVSEMQELVMSMRLVPLSATFHRMYRIVRDMSGALGKDVRLELSGEDTSVDKNVIEHIGDPLIHLVRNSIDHGIETPDEREAAGKPRQGTVTLEAESAGGNVLITISDDGKGLDREKIMKRARENDLLTKPESEYSDREVYNMIFAPGFSTKEAVTEFSGRGVGMDVALSNIAAIGGSVSVESEPGVGMQVLLKIPLTIAILDGMNVSVGGTRMTVPISAISESFKPRSEAILRDIEGNEMIMVRGECYAVMRLHRQWKLHTQVTDLTQGILMMVEQDGKKRCVFVDKLLGRQQIVVKALPTYLKKTPIAHCLSGLTLLSDGSISLILDAGWLVEANIKGYKKGGQLA